VLVEPLLRVVEGSVELADVPLDGALLRVGEQQPAEVHLATTEVDPKPKCAINGRTHVVKSL